MKTAWGDESIRMVASPPMYLLAASFFDAEYERELSSLERIKPAGAKKLHWMDMNARLRRASLSALAELPMSHTIVVATPLNGRKQERARRKALEALLPALEARGMTMLVLESRGRINDRRDIELLLALRRQSALSGKLDISHKAGNEDSRLWIPDQILGVFGDAATASTNEARNELGGLINSIEVLEVPL